VLEEKVPQRSWVKKLLLSCPHGWKCR